MHIDKKTVIKWYKESSKISSLFKNPEEFYEYLFKICEAGKRLELFKAYENNIQDKLWLFPTGLSDDNDDDIYIIASEYHDADDINTKYQFQIENYLSSEAISKMYYIDDFPLNVLENIHSGFISKSTIRDQKLEYYGELKTINQKKYGIQRDVLKRSWSEYSKCRKKAINDERNELIPIQPFYYALAIKLSKRQTVFEMYTEGIIVDICIDDGWIQFWAKWTIQIKIYQI